jgi:gas vesicle protein
LLMGWGAVLGSVAGALISKKSSSDTNQQNYTESKEFAKHGIQWRVEDAKKAGLHPLYALGAPAMSPNPSTPDMTDYSKIGQSVGSSIDKSLDKNSKHQQNIQTHIMNEQLKGLQIDNMLKLRDAGKPRPNPMSDGNYNTKKKDHMLIGGHKVEFNPNWSDAEATEQRHGDIASWLYGIGVIGADIKYNIQKKLKEREKVLKSKGYYKNSKGQYVLEVRKKVGAE